MEEADQHGSVLPADDFYDFTLVLAPPSIIPSEPREQGVTYQSTVQLNDAGVTNSGSLCNFGECHRLPVVVHSVSHPHPKSMFFVGYQPNYLHEC